MRTLLLLIVLPALLSLSWDTNPDHWGIGVLVPGVDAPPQEDFATIFLPQGVGLPYYDDAAGDLAGFLFQRAPDFEGMPGPILLCPIGEKPRPIEGYDFRETSYEMSNLIVFDRIDNWVRVLQNNLGLQAWMNLEDLWKVGFVFQPWMDFILDQDEIYHPHEEYGMNLRAGPGTQYDRLVTLKGDRYSIELTGQTDERWAEVEVIENTAHPCEGGSPTGRKWTGWLKLIDDKGFPNIWYYTRGC
jgi:hypothetical protein